MASVQSRLDKPTSSHQGAVDAARDAVTERGQSSCSEHGQIIQDVGDFNQGRHEEDADDQRPAVLITNDEGIGALGLRALVEALVRTGCYNVLVCAPDSNKSGAGHSVTIFRTLEVNPVDIEGAVAYEVTGTPADCVSLSLSSALFKKKTPSLVLSGINKGPNCGYHMFHSGNVAGAREACIIGVPSISLSLNWKKGESTEADFRTATAVCLPFIRAALLDIGKGVFPKGFFLNVDIPTKPSHHKGFKTTRQGTSRLASKWRAISPQRTSLGPGLWKENAVGARLAQVARAASAVGAARRLNLHSKSMEIESVAGPENDSQNSAYKKKLLFQNEGLENEIGYVDSEDDLGALHEGYVTVTPVGLFTHLEPDSYGKVAEWIASSLEFAASSAL